MKKKNPVRKRIFEIIEKGETGDTASIIFDWSIIGLIVISTVSIIIESFSPQNKELLKLLRIGEIITVIAFSIEYLLRVITCDFKYENKTPIKAFFCYIFSFMALIDLAAILPFYLPMLITVDLRFLRILRMIRILRLFKVSRYNDSFKVIKRVLSLKKYELATTIFATSILLLLSASIMYYVETKAQPEAFPNILAGLWWGIATLTTVGYGDVFPITVLGKLLSGVIALLGIGIVALPTGIISSGFIEVLEEKRKEKEEHEKILYCPYCGKKLQSNI